MFGLAISEPYWAHTKVAGQDQTVLVQLFERRVLTYNPALAANKVEMGNLGQHYYQWRYVENKGGGSVPVATNPSPVPTTGGSNVDSEESNLLNLINQYRQANGKPTLTFNQTLITSAKWMSTDMATKTTLATSIRKGAILSSAWPPSGIPPTLTKLRILRLVTLTRRT